VLLRAAGALLAASLTALALGVAAWFGLSWPTLPQVDLLTLAIGLGAVLGFVCGPSAATSANPVRIALLTAVRAVVIGLTLAMGAAAVTARLSGQPGFDAWSFLGVLLIGVPAAMVLALPVTSFVALAATAVLRLGRRRPLVGSLVIAVIAVGALVGVPALGSSRFTLPISGSSVGSAVHLTITIENHSNQSLTLGVWTTSGDSTGGWTSGVAPCFVTTGSSDEAADWFVTVEPDTGDADAWETIPDPLISAAEAPGTRPQVGVVVAADGTISVAAHRAPPSAEELTDDLCAGQGT
jgi:hypothetical protein